MARARGRAALTHRIRLATGTALAACPEGRWPVLESRINDIHRLTDDGEWEHAVVMLLECRKYMKNKCFELPG